MEAWRRSLMLLGVAAALTACGAIISISELPPATDSDGGGNNNGLVPTHSAASVTFTDEDPGQGAVTSHIAITKAADDTDVTQYDLYWGTSATAKLGSSPSIATLGKTQSLTFDLSTPPPAGATAVIVLTANASGEMTTGVSAPIIDNFASYSDISAGQLAQSGFFPNIVTDTTNAKLLVVTQDGSENSDGGATTAKPGLFRCNLDGSNCAFADIAAGQPAGTGNSPSVAIDAANEKLLVATNAAGKPGLFRCALDGSACAFVDVSAGRGASSGIAPILLVDSQFAKIDIVTEDDSNADKPSLFRCNVDGTACVYTDLTSNNGQGTGSGHAHSSVIDTLDSSDAKLLVVVKNEASSGNLGLFDCEVDGTDCSYVDISAGVTTGSSNSTALVVDQANSKIDVVTDDSTGNAVLVRCGAVGANLGGGCQKQALLPVQNAAQKFSAQIDTTNGKLLVVFSNSTGLPTFARCELDGTKCLNVDLSAGQGPNSGLTLSSTLDVAGQRLLVASDDGAKSDAPALFSIGLW